MFLICFGMKMPVYKLESNKLVKDFLVEEWTVSVPGDMDLL